MTLEIHLIRHTSTELDRNICCGQADVEVAGTFEQEANAVKGRLPQGLDYYSSPLIRCRRLAEFLAPERVIYDSRLMELSFGTWERRSWEEIDRKESDAWALDFVNASPPGGETALALLGRCSSFLGELSSAGPRRVGIITHAGWIRAAVIHYLGLPPTRLFDFRIDHGSVSKVEVDESATRIVYLNRA